MKSKKTWLGIIISALFLYLAFRKSDWGQIWEVVRRVDPLLLIASQVVLGVHFWLRAVRWKYLMLPNGRPDQPSLLGAVMIGFMANNVLPLRVGEFVRAIVLARRERLSVSSVFATLVVERIFDGCLLLLMFLGSLLFLPLDLSPDVQVWVRAFAYMGAIIFLTAIICLLLIKWKTESAIRLIEKALGHFPNLKEITGRVVSSFVSGLEAVGDPRLFLIITLYSLSVWLTCAAFYWVTTLAFTTSSGANLGLLIRPLGSIFLLGAIALGVMLPSSPGFVGTFQFACITALAAMGVEQATAESYAIVGHAVQYIPITLAGIIFLYLQNFSFQDIRAGSEKIQDDLEEYSRASE